MGNIHNFFLQACHGSVMVKAGHWQGWQHHLVNTIQPL